MSDAIQTPTRCGHADRLCLDFLDETIPAAITYLNHTRDLCALPGDRVPEVLDALRKARAVFKAIAETAADMQARRGA